MSESLGVTSEKINYDNLVISGGVTVAQTIKSGENIVRGELLGKVTADGKLIASLSGVSDGSQAPYAIAAKDTDASSADVVAPVFVCGVFNANNVTFGAGHTFANTFDALRDLGIILKDDVLEG